MVGAFRRFLEHLYSLLTVACTIDTAAQILKERPHNLHVQLIILCHQNPDSGKLHLFHILFFLLTWCLCHRQHKGKEESTAFPQLAFQLHFTVHHVNQTVTDGKTQTAALTMGGSVAKLLKHPKNPLAIFLTDTNSVVSDSKVDACHAIFQNSLFHCQLSFHSSLRVFYRIAQQIDEHLTDTQSISIKPAVGQLNIRFKNLPLFCEFSIQHRMQFIQKIGQIKVVFHQRHFATFNLRHIQNIVQQPQQIIRRSPYLFQTINPHLL